MRQRLDALSDETKETVQVAAVLPDRFTAALLAQMLERRPAALVSAVDEAVRADLLVEDGDHLRFGHDLLREATRQSLPPSLRRAIERQSATVMMEMGAAPAEVATQLVRSAEVGDQAAVTALREAAKSVANSDKSGAADLSRRALDLLPADDPQRGALVVETVGLLNRSGRYQEADDLAAAMLAQLSPEEEAQDATAHSERRRCVGGPHRGEPPRAAVEPGQRRHPGPSSGLAGMQPCRQRSASRRVGHQRGRRRGRGDRRSGEPDHLRDSACHRRLRRRIRTAWR